MTESVFNMRIPLELKKALADKVSEDYGISLSAFTKMLFKAYLKGTLKIESSLDRQKKTKITQIPKSQERNIRDILNKRIF